MKQDKMPKECIRCRGNGCVECAWSGWSGWIGEEVRK